MGGAAPPFRTEHQETRKEGRVSTGCGTSTGYNPYLSDKINRPKDSTSNGLSYADTIQILYGRITLSNDILAQYLVDLYAEKNKTQASQVVHKAQQVYRLNMATI